MLYRSEVRLRTGIMGEPAKHIRPLSETRFVPQGFSDPKPVLTPVFSFRAIENGANSLAEGFLFTVAAGLILGESWRSSRSQSKRRDSVDDQLDSLGTKMVELTTRVDEISMRWEDELQHAKQRSVFFSILLLLLFFYQPHVHG